MILDELSNEALSSQSAYRIQIPLPPQSRMTGTTNWGCDALHRALNSLYDILSARSLPETMLRYPW